jgi:hypothetical protein
MMKLLFILLGLTAVPAAVNAQSARLPFIKLIDKSKAPKFKNGLLPATATLIRITTMGKVYALPIDKMPCLVSPATSKAAMPVLKPALSDTPIPNALPQE